MTQDGALTWPLALAVATGGGTGALLRHVLGRAVQQATGSAFPWGTLCVNAAGCLLLGLLAAWFSGRSGGTLAAPFLVTGLLGGFTTFSAFSGETIALLRQGRTGLAAAYVGLSLGVCLGAAAAGSLVGSGLTRAA